ncbi:hypothetical protein [Amycolatopsis sp. PS_44_ISF1]|uniref:hypothetical protein n=1 Tax=Amycolatopsis sp. PS_44_ISF1 TaxID=2974917 RepID=UPI0028DF3096|nr:hypothetical protein [Amycolatopsis sp. PS_44_ISF1]MDT8912041.1 hypothetical protein [Amycolatopsis sp. PS_44_ISF1]
MTSIEEWLELTVTVAKSGRVEVAGEAIDGDATGNKLSFRIGGLDQSELPAILDDLSSIEAKFPVLGKR